MVGTKTADGREDPDAKKALAEAQGAFQAFLPDNLAHMGLVVTENQLSDAKFGFDVPDAKNQAMSELLSL